MVTSNDDNCKQLVAGNYDVIINDLANNEEEQAFKNILTDYLEHFQRYEQELGQPHCGYMNEFKLLKELSRALKEDKANLVIGELDCNQKKNRYKDIIPFSHTRVILQKANNDDARQYISPAPTIAGLQSVQNDEGSCYINANYIQGPSGNPRAYIACQGPLPCTLIDFWRMIWECNVSVLIMACNEYESGKPKCELYWSDELESSQIYGNIQVTLMRVRQINSDFLIRKFSVKLLEPEIHQDICSNDNNVQRSTSDQMRHLDETNHNNDKNNNTDNESTTSSSATGNCLNMKQTLNHGPANGLATTIINTQNLNSMLNNNTDIHRLNQNPSPMSTNSSTTNTSGCHINNTTNNNNNNIINNNINHLHSARIVTNNGYKTASINGATSSESINTTSDNTSATGISATRIHHHHNHYHHPQRPSIHPYQQSSNIMLDGSSQLLSDSSRQSSPGNRATAATTTIVTTNTTTTTTNNISQQSVRPRKVLAERTICQFHYTTWPDHGVPDSVDPILELVRLMREVQPTEDKPILVHCSAGCGRTGTICCIDYVWGLLRTGKLNRDFNLCRIISEMRQQRMAMVQTLEQYILCHRVVAALFIQQLQLIDSMNAAAASHRLMTMSNGNGHLLNSDANKQQIGGINDGGDSNGDYDSNSFDSEQDLGPVFI